MTNAPQIEVADREGEARDGLAAVATVRVGGLDVARLSLAETADVILKAAVWGRARGQPVYMTSANGEVIARLRLEPKCRPLFLSADLISADGQPMVSLSRWLCKSPLPERVATTDLFDFVAERAEKSGARFYLLGGTPDVNARAVAAAQRKFPRLEIIGARDGYMSPRQELDAVDEIARLAPDILWIGMGVPREQEFVLRWRERLRGVGVIKTTGGLFDFMAQRVKRAPPFVQRAGFEWAWRLCQEPSRLFVRYIVTNPVALYALITDSR